MTYVVHALVKKPGKRFYEWTAGRDIRANDRVHSTRSGIVLGHDPLYPVWLTPIEYRRRVVAKGRVAKRRAR